jgi:hypothetical protein
LEKTLICYIFKPKNAPSFLSTPEILKAHPNKSYRIAENSNDKEKMVFVPRNSAKIRISIRTKIILIIVFVFLVSSFGAYRTFIFLSENRTLSVYSDLTGRMRYASQQLVKALALGSENEIISAIGTFEFLFATLM